MPIKIDATSHTDHHLTKAHLEFIAERFSAKTEFFIETIDIPSQLGELTSGIYGPIAGDPPVADADCFIAIRMGRPWPTRLIEKPVRPTRKMTVVAGPGDDENDKDLVLYTAYGGPCAPREPGDFGLGLHCPKHAPFAQALVNKTYQTPEGQVLNSDILLGRIEESQSCEDCRMARFEATKSVAFWREHAIAAVDCELVRNSTELALREWRAKASLFLSKRFPGNHLQFTCDRCSDNTTCRYSYDPACVSLRCLRTLLAAADR